MPAGEYERAQSCEREPKEHATPAIELDQPGDDAREDGVVGLAAVREEQIVAEGVGMQQGERLPQVHHAVMPDTAVGVEEQYQAGGHQYRCTPRHARRRVRARTWGNVWVRNRHCR